MNDFDFLFNQLSARRNVFKKCNFSSRKRKLRRPSSCVSLSLHFVYSASITFLLEPLYLFFLDYSPFFASFLLSLLAVAKLIASLSSLGKGIDLTRLHGAPSPACRCNAIRRVDTFSTLAAFFHARPFMLAHRFAHD